MRNLPTTKRASIEKVDPQAPARAKAVHQRFGKTEHNQHFSAKITELIIEQKVNSINPTTKTGPQTKASLN